MKSIVCGKGGCGKSIIATLLAKEMAKRGYKVLVVDTDESNFDLHSQLGMDPPRDFMNYFGGKKVLFEKVKTLRGEWRIDELPQGYLSERGNIKLLAMGKIYDFGEGCACPINALASKLLENLVLEEDEFLIADTDAGIEHLGRGVERGCDLILAVVEPSQESLKLAGKIARMVEGIGKNIYYILNKVDEETRGILLELLDESRVAGVIPQDERIFRSCLKGEELDFEVEGIKELADLLESSSGAKEQKAHRHNGFPSHR